MAANKRAETGGAGSLQSEPMESSQGSIEKGKARFSVRSDGVLLTFTHGFPVSSTDTYTDWIRHPLGPDNSWWKLCMEIHGNSVVFWCLYWEQDSASDTVRPWLPRAFSYVISKGTEGVLARGQVPWFCSSDALDDWARLPAEIHFPVPADNTFFVSFSFSILNDKDMIAALGERSMFKALSVKPASQELTIVRRLWDRREGADLVIETADGKDIKAHKCFLIENSRVFAAMFTHDTREKSSGRLRLNDLSHAVVREMLHFFYLEFVESRDTHVLIELVKVGDRYDVSSLKDTCETLLSEKLFSEPELALNLLPFSNTLNLKRLKRQSELALMSYEVERVPCVHLAFECSAEMLLRYSVAMLHTCRQGNILEDLDWKQFQAEHFNAAQSILNEFLNVNVYSVVSCAEVRKKRVMS